MKEYKTNPKSKITIPLKFSGGLLRGCWCCTYTSFWGIGASSCTYTPILQAKPWATGGFDTMCLLLLFLLLLLLLLP